MKEFRANGKTPIKKEKIEKKIKKAVQDHFNTNVDVELNEIVVQQNEKGKLVCHLDVNAVIPEEIVPKKFLEKYLK